MHDAMVRREDMEAQVNRATYEHFRDLFRSAVARLEDLECGHVDAAVSSRRMIAWIDDYLGGAQQQPPSSPGLRLVR